MNPTTPHSMSKDRETENAGGQAGQAANGRLPAPLIREVQSDEPLASDTPSISDKFKTLLVGKPLDLTDRRIYHHVSLVAFLAWVGLGADGLSSSCYGPSMAYTQLSRHHHLEIFIPIETMITVWVISACYSHIIEAFPSGGGG